MKGASAWKRSASASSVHASRRTCTPTPSSKLRGVKCEILAVCSKTRESAEAFARKFNIPHVYTDPRALLERRDIQLVSLPVVTNLHHRLAIACAEAGKHIVMEKPLTGCFVDADRMNRRKMMAEAMQNADAVAEACRRNKTIFGYAENFVYAPPVAKLRRLMDAGGGDAAGPARGGEPLRIARRLFPPLAHGGGRLHAAHGLAPYRRRDPPQALRGTPENGTPIRVKSVIADVGQLTKTPAFQAESRKWLVHSWEDVEDWSAAILTFEDGTKATVMSTDVSLGGVKNLLTAYMSNGVVQVNINPNTSLQVYAPDGAIWGEEYITEKVETKGGWQFPSPDEDWMRGYPQEMEDFVDAVREQREPLSGLLLAHETVEVIYAGYVSAEEGRRIELKR